MSIGLEKIMVALGYPGTTAMPSFIVPQSRLTVEGSLILSPEREAQAQAIFTELVKIDELLKEAMVNSVAVALGTMKLNYPYHIAALKLEASGLLTQLAQLVGIPVFYDKYTQEYPQGSRFYAIFGINPHSQSNQGYVRTQW